jgi:hypothetical protein
MVNSTKHSFYVGDRAPDDSRQVRLDGIIISPKHPKGDILFLQGFSGRHEDYMHLLMPLGEEFRVITYNYRGHGKSKGRFTNASAINDTEQILESIPRKGNILAHSYAIFVTRLKSDKLQRAYLLEPYLDPSMLPAGFRLGVKVCSLASVLPIVLPGIDALLDASGIPQEKGLNNKRPLQSFAELEKIRAYDFDKPLAFTLASRDELFSVPYPEKYMQAIDMIKEKYPQARNRSEIVRGLNHCLNLAPNDFAPFLKPEEGKNSDRIIEDIVNFFSE